MDHGPVCLYVFNSPKHPCKFGWSTRDLWRGGIPQRAFEDCGLFHHPSLIRARDLTFSSLYIESKPAVLGSTWNNSESSMHFTHQQYLPMTCCHEMRRSIFHFWNEILWHPRFLTNSHDKITKRKQCQMLTVPTVELQKRRGGMDGELKIEPTLNAYEMRSRVFQQRSVWTWKRVSSYWILLVCFPASCHWWFGSFGCLWHES